MRELKKYISNIYMPFSRLQQNTAQQKLICEIVNSQYCPPIQKLLIKWSLNLIKVVHSKMWELCNASYSMYHVHNVGIVLVDVLLQCFSAVAQGKCGVSRKFTAFTQLHSKFPSS